jgi:arylsulfatase A-like enzyme
VLNLITLHNVSLCMQAVITELVDVMPSLSDLAGLPAPLIHPGEAALDGVSFAPVLEGDSGTARAASTASTQTGATTAAAGAAAGKGWALR